MAFRGEVNDSDVQIALRYLPATLSKHALEGLGEIGGDFRDNLAKDFGRRSGSGNAGRFWLRRRIRQYRRDGALDQIRLGLFTADPAAELHWRGGVIRARKGAMAVPIADSLTATGRVRRNLRKDVFKPSTKSGKGKGAFDPSILRGRGNVKIVRLAGKLYIAEVRKSRGHLGRSGGVERQGPRLSRAARKKLRTKITKLYAKLEKQVTVEGGNLRFFEVFEQRAGQQGRILQKSVERTLEEIARLRGTSIQRLRIDR